ncbi:MAG: hypothetical protein D3903_10175 [Candidatus Electrothrix sp. GM3_4]|nr:hypothetical protein [Candidatus Electrothrix sp. GM3_4]
MREGKQAPVMLKTVGDGDYNGLCLLRQSNKESIRRERPLQSQYIVPIFINRKNFRNGKEQNFIAVLRAVF